MKGRLRSGQLRMGSQHKHCFNLLKASSHCFVQCTIFGASFLVRSVNEVVIKDELAIIACDSQKCTHIPLRGWLLKILHYAAANLV
jgi:hypothetical protein